ncbi:MGH1-like glycoside hydrolase domain-containing protein [Rhizobium tubonense]|uniref:Glycoside hydrolase family 37 n=1 Tax=Rhizobium tubonense TaxID=484088 RepID=A0A2W4CW53_9HYPH|nr:trehalase family glycosidase [Rhizobium tubonense]PZM14515.1 glycoside hydrolase family 37 [Rhizobium tubonense]
MCGHSTIPLNRAWNSWSLRPAELTFLPLGIRVTPVLYSSRSRRASLIEPRSDKVRFGRHTIDNRLIELETELSGTVIGLRAQSGDPFAIRGDWQATALGEWGTRFWLTLAVSADGGEAVKYDPVEKAALVCVDRRHVAIVTRDAPIQVTGHDSVDALAADFEANGYFYTATRSNADPVLGLRFNMEMMREGGYAAAVADTEALAIAKARACLAASDATLPSVHQGRFAGSLDAVRDVVGWNTIWDRVNHRPYTAVTRIWNLGEFAVWYNDQTFAGLLAGLFDADVARENMSVALAGATPQGNIACIVTSNDAWVDRSQPPHGGLVAWLLYQRTGEKSLLQASYQALARNQRWWRENRDPDRSGLISCGTSDVGEGLYKGTVFGARNETGMDNSATHDEATYDPATRTLSTYDLGLNCALALDAEMLSKIASVLGYREDALEFASLADISRNLIGSELWDESRGLFANRQRAGGFVRSLSPTTFYPLLCGAANPEQASRLLEHLADPETFGGAFVLPNSTRDDPSHAENVYWRGRIWPNVNYMVWLGLRRYGFNRHALELAGKSYELFMQNWKEHRIAAENYNSDNGEAMDQGDTDPFYIWSALLPLMAVEEICGFDPWTGWTITSDGADVILGPLLTPVGRVTLRTIAGVTSLFNEAGHLLTTDFIGRIAQINFGRGYFACILEGGSQQDARLSLPGLDVDSIIGARLGDTTLTAYAVDGGVEFVVPGALDGKALQLWFMPVDNADVASSNAWLDNAKG